MLDLERDLPTSEKDVLALRRAPTSLSFQQYVLFVESLPPPADLRERRGPRGDRPFELDATF